MEVRPGQLERQMKNKTASSKDKMNEENFWSYTLRPQKEFKKFKKLKVEPIFKFIENYPASWKEQLIERMDSSRISNNLLNYRPHRKRSLGRPLKRWSETVTGHLDYYLMKKKKKNLCLNGLQMPHTVSSLELLQ
jgi:hypothetical protein